MVVQVGQKYVQLSEGHLLACAVPNPVDDAVITSIAMPFLVLLQPFVTTGCFPRWMGQYEDTGAVVQQCGDSCCSTALKPSLLFLTLAGQLCSALLTLLFVELCCKPAYQCKLK